VLEVHHCCPGNTLLRIHTSLEQSATHQRPAGSCCLLSTTAPAVRHSVCSIAGIASTAAGTAQPAHLPLAVKALPCLPHECPLAVHSARPSTPHQTRFPSCHTSLTRPAAHQATAGTDPDSGRQRQEASRTWVLHLGALQSSYSAQIHKF